MSDPNILDQSGLGSTDWAGPYAPPGGTHTGLALLTFVNGDQFTVAHSVAECQQKIAEGVGATNPGSWVAFDQPNEPLPIVLNVANVIVPLIVEAASGELYANTVLEGNTQLIAGGLE